MTGHPNSWTYFAVIKGDDESMLAHHTEALFNDYLVKAPAGKKGIANEKIHVGWSLEAAVRAKQKGVLERYFPLPQVVGQNGRPAVGNSLGCYEQCSRW